MSARTRVGVIFGGRSGEHEVSVASARSIVAALDPDRFEAVAVGIARDGSWHRIAVPALLGTGTGKYSEVVGQGMLVPAQTEVGSSALDRAVGGGLSERFAVDVFFPIVHGTQGEDGALQGLLEMAGVPYVGCGVLGSAVGMDKDVAKRLLREAGLPVVECIVLRSGRGFDDSVARRVASEIGFPCFVKPANLGSSVGITKVAAPAELAGAVAAAFRFDNKLLIERAVNAREIETAVLGGQPPTVSVPGEVVSRHEFYSYEAKYLDENGAELLVPAPLDAEKTQAVQAMSLRAFEALELEGLSRIDFFLDRDTDQWFINEVNTLPGFTQISMYARMWQHSGLPFGELVTRLIDLSVERFERRRALCTEHTLTE